MGNWISYLEIAGCSCDYGSFNFNKTNYVIDPASNQGNPLFSKSPITISTGNQTQDVELTFAVNGHSVGVASTSASGQQGGIYYTTNAIALDPGSNSVTISAIDPLHLLPRTTYTITIPYRPARIANTALPQIQGSPTLGGSLTCLSGAWSADPTPTQVNYSFEGSADGVSWTQVSTASVSFPSSDQAVLGSHTINAADQGKAFRCSVTTSNIAGTVTASSAATATVPLPPPVTTTVHGSTNPSSGGGSSGSGPGTTTTPTTTTGPTTATNDSAGGSTSSSTAALPKVTVSNPTVVIGSGGKQTISFSLQLGSQAAIQITLVTDTGKQLMSFNTSARKGKTTFVQEISALHLKKGKTFHLNVATTAHGKTRRITTNVKL
jgi:hypothetical protein